MVLRPPSRDDDHNAPDGPGTDNKGNGIVLRPPSREDDKPGHEENVQIVLKPSVAELGERVTVDFDAAQANACNVSVTGTEAPGRIEPGQSIRADIGTDVSVECDGPGGNVVVSEGLDIRAARLSWDPPTRNVDGTPLDDLSGFRIYYGPKGRSHESVIRVDDPTTRQLTRAFPSGMQFFSMTAVDEQGNESAYSAQISKRIP